VHLVQALDQLASAGLFQQRGTLSEPPLLRNPLVVIGDRRINVGGRLPLARHLKSLDG
jgi:hypothetical protein